jgi:anaerobic ribonucleoside-triphosphate reductase activating protein
VIRLSRAHFPVTALGPGRRLGIWVQGCGLACKGCVSRDTWDADGGREVEPELVDALWKDAIDQGADGLTVSGGEPFDQPAELVRLLRAAARERGTAPLDLLVYTGYEEAEARARAPEVFELADAVITGRYEAGRPTRLIWRGSAGQRLIPLTALGERLYRPYLDHCPEHAPMQVGADESGIWFIGVPPPGTLPRLERAMRERGVTVKGVSWRP